MWTFIFFGSVYSALYLIAFFIVVVVFALYRLTQRFKNQSND